MDKKELVRMKDNNNYCGYHGKLTSSRTVKDILMAEAIYVPQLKLPEHSHYHAGFCLILRGKYTESYGKTRLDCKPSHVKFQPAGEAHSNLYGNERVHCFTVELKTEWLTRMGAHHLVGSSPMVTSSHSIAWLMMKLRKEFYSMDVEAPLAVEGLILELLAETSRNRKRISGDNSLCWLRQAKEFLDENFSQPLTLSDIAESVKVHPVYLANSFRQHYHFSVGEYLRRRRVEFACHKISTSKDSLVEIALAAGFSNQSHFTRIFKQVTGMTPAQYRAATKIS